RLGAAVAVLYRLVAERIEEVRKPAVVLGQVALVLRDFLEGRKNLRRAQDIVELTANEGPIYFEILSPRKDACLEDRWIADLGAPGNYALQLSDENGAERYCSFAQSGLVHFAISLRIPPTT